MWRLLSTDDRDLVMNMKRYRTVDEQDMGASRSTTLYER
jgi:hypothetical protein